MASTFVYEDEYVFVRKNRAGCLVVSNKKKGGSVRVTAQDGNLYVSPDTTTGAQIHLATFMGMPAMVVP